MGRKKRLDEQVTPGLRVLLCVAVFAAGMVASQVWQVNLVGSHGVGQSGSDNEVRLDDTDDSSRDRSERSGNDTQLDVNDSPGSGNDAQLDVSDSPDSGNSSEVIVDDSPNSGNSTDDDIVAGTGANAGNSTDDGIIAGAGANAGNDSRNSNNETTNSDRHDTTSETNTRSSNDRTNNGGQQANDNGVINNNVPLEWGKATFVSAASADGEDGFGPDVLLELDAGLPTNGNRLFVACNLLGDTGEPQLWFTKVEVVRAGRQTVPVHFGGAHINADPSAIGSVRRCAVISADRGATETLLFLQRMDLEDRRLDESGRPYNERRRSLPTGAAVVSTNSVLITLDRI